MTILSPIMLLICYLYAGIICYLIIVLLLPYRRRRSSCENTLPGISIVIPFRNEAANLPKLLESLGKQTYQGAIEILLVNDESTDDFKPAIDSTPVKFPLRIIDSTFTAERRLTSKQQALDTGIAAATHDFIGLTDADMILNPDWLDALAKQAMAGADLVFGHTTILAGRSHERGTAGLFAWFQSFQLEALFATAYAFHRSGIPGSCMGNNMLVSRTAYKNVGGFDTTGYSIVEDCALLNEFRKKGLRTAAAEPFYPSAATQPASSAPVFYQQIRRWIYGGCGLSPVLAGTGALLVAQAILVSLALAGMLPDLVSAFSLCNIVLTWFFIIIAFRQTGSREEAILFPPFFILMIPEIVLIIFSFLSRRPVVWKDRRI
ncbi:MAG: glycosyltransferase [Chitinispirillaceae bacterium]|nr:glycosyltransferase [Chitinispirillaceae bacterium]